MSAATKTRRSFNQKKKKKDEKQNKGLFAECHTVAPAPSRDYYGLQLYQKKFVWTRWMISHGPYSNPVQRVVPMGEFLKDLTMQNELAYIFGADITALISDLALEKWSLTTMPSHILQKIFNYISVADILRLSQVCKRLSKECSKNELWKGICKKQWKILIHNDIEKADLIGWKRVYLEKMRPKRYKTAPVQNRQSILHRNRVNSVSALNTPDSRTPKSNFTIHKRDPQEASRSTSEIFGKDFKVTSTSTGKFTDRTYTVIKGRCSSRNSEARPTSSGKMNPTPRSKYSSSRSVINLVPLAENPRENQTALKNKSPRVTKCKVTSIRTRSETSQFGQHPETRSVKLRADIPRPATGRSLKAKQ